MSLISQAVRHRCHGKSRLFHPIHKTINRVPHKGDPMSVRSWNGNLYMVKESVSQFNLLIHLCAMSSGKQQPPSAAPAAGHHPDQSSQEQNLVDLQHSEPPPTAAAAAARIAGSTRASESQTSLAQRPKRGTLIKWLDTTLSKTTNGSLANSFVELGALPRNYAKKYKRKKRISGTEIAQATHMVVSALVERR